MGMQNLTHSFTQQDMGQIILIFFRRSLQVRLQVPPTVYQWRTFDFDSSMFSDLAPNLHETFLVAIRKTNYTTVEKEFLAPTYWTYII